MVNWRTFEDETVDLADFGRARLDRRVSFLATVRPDGGPRVHPVTPWISEGSLHVRMYPTSPKGFDLLHDPRYALHSLMYNDDGVGGEFAVRGRAALVEDPEVARRAYRTIGGPGTERPLVLFELELDEAIATEYVEDEPVRRRWQAGSRLEGSELGRGSVRQATRPGDPSGAE